MSVVAIRRDADAVIAPEPTEQLLAGDQLVVVGRQEDLPGFLRHVDRRARRWVRSSFVLGGALLAAGVLARSGRRIGLPTIPLFMAAGILLGPNTPGLALVEHPEDLELLAKVGLILLLFHLGLEFSLGDLVVRWPQAPRRRRHLPRCSTSAAASCSASPSAGARPRRW